MIFVLPLIGSLFVYLVFFHYTALKTWKTGLLCLCLGILLYPAAVMHQEYNAEIIYRYLVFLLFAVIALIDLYCMIIPDMLVLITLLLTFPFTAVSPWERVTGSDPGGFLDRGEVEEGELWLGRCQIMQCLCPFFRLFFFVIFSLQSCPWRPVCMHCLMVGTC